MKIGIVIQARMGSSRLKNKILEKIGSKEIILFLFERLKTVEGVSEIILATSENEEENPLVSFANKIGLLVFRGSLEDVLSRFYECAKQRDLDVIVRVTADDPFKDPGVINQAIRIFLEGDFDYVSNTIHPTYPEGIDIEVFSYSALKEANLSSSLATERMHVTPYIWKNPKKFSLHNFTDKKDNSSIRLTCDYREDLDYLNEIYSRTSSDDFTYLDIIDIVNEFKIKNMRKTIRNEGYLSDTAKENADE